MKVIDLLNKIANGEIEENTTFEYSHGNGYKEYCNVRQFFNRYIVDKENLNLEIWEDKVEDKKIEKIDTKKGYYGEYIEDYCFKSMPLETLALNQNELVIIDKINEIIDKLNNIGLN